MNAEEFTEAVREDNRTALSRLGSSKALYADTEGEMEDAAVLAAAADRAHHAAETLGDWAADEPVEAAATLFAETAETEREHRETAASDLDDYVPGDPPAVQAHLREYEGTVERVGGFVGWALAAGENAGQVVGYFVGNADPGTASTFRSVDDDVEGYLAAAEPVLAAVCDDGDDWDAALDAAAETVQADYDDYFETLESLGVNPKPVC